MKVSDAGVPPCSDTTVAVVNVRRNLQDPRFKRGEWTVTIKETRSLTEAIVRVEAEDKDEKVSVYSSTIIIELEYIELCHLDVLHFVIEERRHTVKCCCIGLMLFRYLSYVWVKF